MNPDSLDVFQAQFYNTIASNGIYVLKKRRENGLLKFSPKLVMGEIETVIICSPSGTCLRVRDRLDLNEQRIREVWHAKQLGFQGLTPDSTCDNNCPHHRIQKKYGIRLKEGDAEPLPPLPLVFAKGIVDSGYDLDLNFQVAYATRLFNEEFYEKHLDSAICKDLLIRNVELNSKAVHLALDEHTCGRYSCQPTSEELLRTCRDQLKPWNKILGRRVAASAPEILKLALVIYSLHEGSKALIEDTWSSWQ